MHTAPRPLAADPAVHFELFSTSFCGACRNTRMALDRVLQLVPGSTLAEFDVAGDPQRAESLNIEHTPTTIIRAADGREVFRAAGVPSLPQLLVATARARESTQPSPAAEPPPTSLIDGAQTTTR